MRLIKQLPPFTGWIAWFTKKKKKKKTNNTVIVR
jgi:hypothetical protein